MLKRTFTCFQNSKGSFFGSIIFGVGGITHTFLIAINIETKKRDIVPKILYNVIG